MERAPSGRDTPTNTCTADTPECFEPMDSETDPRSEKTLESTTWLAPRASRRFALVDRQLTVAVVTTGVMVAGTLGFWLRGKLAWNHEPLMSQAFAQASLETLSNRPHSAALEFHHALASGDFGLARAFLSPAAADLVDRAQAACGSDCPRPELSRGRVFARAAVLENTPRTAVVRAEAFDTNDAPLNAATYDLVREADSWRVIGLRAP